MIRGFVSPAIEPLVLLTVRGPSGAEREVVFGVDTGFIGTLTLPAAVISALELPYLFRGETSLADGSIVRFNVHSAVLDWDGVPRRVTVETAETGPLLGMELIRGHRVFIDADLGGEVRIERKN